MPYMTLPGHAADGGRPYSLRAILQDAFDGPGRRHRPAKQLVDRKPDTKIGVIFGLFASPPSAVIQSLGAPGGFDTLATHDISPEHNESIGVPQQWRLGSLKLWREAVGDLGALVDSSNPLFGTHRTKIRPVTAHQTGILRPVNAKVLIRRALKGADLFTVGN